MVGAANTRSPTADSDAGVGPRPPECGASLRLLPTAALVRYSEPMNNDADIDPAAAEERCEDNGPLRVDPAVLLEVIEGRGGRGMTVNQMVAHERAQQAPELASSDVRRAVRRALRSLERSGEVSRGRGKRYFAAKHSDMRVGVLRTNRSGGGWLEGADKPVWLSHRALRGAVDGDRVAVRLEKPRREARERGAHDGTVVRVLERARQTVVGRWAAGEEPLVLPFDWRLDFDVVATRLAVDGVPADGEVVVITLEKVSDRRRRATGDGDRAPRTAWRTRSGRAGRAADAWHPGGVSCGCGGRG